MGIIDGIRRGVAVLGAGGAGDVVSAYMLCLMLRRLMNVRKCTPVAILWERWVIDPFPGPIPRALLRNVRTSSCVYVSSSSYAVRGSDFRFRPQASIIAELARTVIPSITLEYGVRGIRECIEELMGIGYEFILALDVGGDILALGHEEELWSPLTDALVLASLTWFKASSVVGILAPGADGELSHDYVIRRIEDVGRSGGLIGAIGLLKDLVEDYATVLKKTFTEAGRIPYMALRGVLGEVAIRGGSRRVKITPSSIITYLLDPCKVIEQQPLPQALINTKSLAEALTKAEELGIPTELHLEIEIAKTYGCGPHTINKIDWKTIRNKVKQSLKTKKNKQH
ncbi:MAG: hypothetical protein DRO18_04595 [Thermoprotei archaeon]|nr:MAG: hypothetical protein DRO18_04595 [Thermoprotei archaeon]